MIQSISPCPTCQNTEAMPIFTKNGYHLVQCTRCNLIHISPMPTTAELSAHYQNAAYFSGEEAQGYRDYRDMEKALLPHFQRRIATIDHLLTGKGELLDFGCAAGFFLKVVRQDGWKINGVELSQEMGKEASELLKTPIYQSLQALPTRPLDAITFWEVIEHLPSPLEQLREMYNALRPGGILMLSTPNTGHWKAIRQPEQWDGYRPPSHLQFFTRQSLQDVLQRAGFERVEVRGVMPLPPLPGWLQRLSEPLRQQLGSGSAPNWRMALYSWRAIRLAGWAWQKAAYPQDDIFATLEATAFRPL